MESFSRRIYDIVTRIPSGKVITYGRIAEMTGNPKGARAVGWAMGRCPDGLPWHRVVKSDGTLMNGMAGEIQRALLTDEGVAPSGGKVDMSQCAWRDEEFVAST